jgi:uncharacterized Ntn-hydrolase superfamily protein
MRKHPWKQASSFAPSHPRAVDMPTGEAFMALAKRHIMRSLDTRRGAARMTFSIAARCARTRAFGVAVASSSPAVAARCAYVRADVGAVATQNVTDPRLGPQALELLALGASAADTVRILEASAPHMPYRQMAIIDAAGRVAGFSGAKSLVVHAIAETEDAIAAGNLLAAATVPRAMVEAFAAAREADLGDRLVLAMQAGLVAGGEAGPVHSAGMLVADKVPWPVADLRIDWHDHPIGELARLWALWKPQLAGYVRRALTPDAAPSYGVPGDP